MADIEPRARILQQLRAARASSRLPRTQRPPVPAAADRSFAHCVDRFTHEATALGCECYVESSARLVRDRVQRLAMGLLTVAWDPEQLPYDIGHSVQALRGSAPREDLAGAEIGITGCDAAIADTGSLALLSGPGRSRAVSLLPPIHLAVVQQGQCCASSSDFFRQHRERLAHSASCTLITGPSRTADIELTLTLGIHGPGRVVIVIGP